MNLQYKVAACFIGVCLGIVGMTTVIYAPQLIIPVGLGIGVAQAMTQEALSK